MQIIIVGKSQCLTDSTSDLTSVCFKSFISYQKIKYKSCSKISQNILKLCMPANCILILIQIVVSRYIKAITRSLTDWLTDSSQNLRNYWTDGDDTWAFLLGPGCPLRKGFYQVYRVSDPDPKYFIKSYIFSLRNNNALGSLIPLVTLYKLLGDLLNRMY